MEVNTKHVLAVFSLMVGLSFGVPYIVTEQENSSWLMLALIFLGIALFFWIWIMREQKSAEEAATDALDAAEENLKKLEAQAAEAQEEVTPTAEKDLPIARTPPVAAAVGETEPSVAEEVAETVEEVVEDVSETVEEVAEDASDEVEAVVEDVSETVEEVAEDASDEVEEVAEDASDEVEEVAEDASDEVEEVAEDASDEVEAVVEDVSETVEEVVEETSDEVEDVTEDISEAVAVPVEIEEDDEAETVEEAPEPVAEASDEPDDLTRVEGIGPKYAELLGEAGITTFAQVAEMDEETIVATIKAQGGRKSASMGTWAEQAKLAAAGDWDALEALQDELNGGRR